MDFSLLVCVASSASLGGPVATECDMRDHTAVPTPCLSRFSRPLSYLGRPLFYTSVSIHRNFRSVISSFLGVFVSWIFFLGGMD